MRPENAGSVRNEGPLLVFASVFVWSAVLVAFLLGLASYTAPLKVTPSNYSLRSFKHFHCGLLLPACVQRYPADGVVRIPSRSFRWVNLKVSSIAHFARIIAGYSICRITHAEVGSRRLEDGDDDDVWLLMRTRLQRQHDGTGRWSRSDSLSDPVPNS